MGISNISIRGKRKGKRLKTSDDEDVDLFMDTVNDPESSDDEELYLSD